MKKTAFLLVLLAIGIGASAQSLNVQSASEAMRRGYLDKAKKLIDQACEHEQTKNDAKTWYYTGLIYSQIGGETTKAKSKYKDLAPDWLEKAKTAAFRCKELDTEKEYADKNNTVFDFVGNGYYQKAIAAFNNAAWEECMTLCEESVNIFNESGKREFVAESYLLAGKAACNAHNNDKIMKYFKPLVRTRTKENLVYRKLFEIYRSSGDTNEALKLAKNYVKSCPDDFNANMMMAQCYMMKGNMTEGNAEIQKALDKSTDPIVRAQLLAAAGAALEEVQNYTEAENRYKESLQSLPNQFLANYGLGKMLYNRAADKLTEANNIPPDDESGKYEVLVGESKDFFRQSIPYMVNAIAYIDAMDAEGQAQNRTNLYNCMRALNSSYARLEMYDEQNVIKARMTELEKQASQQ